MSPATRHGTSDTFAPSTGAKHEMADPTDHGNNDGSGPGSGGQADGEGSKSKKQKFSRSRTACLPCRSRKSRCGALPPHPCPNCIEAKLECTWPEEDGRSSKARMQRASQAGRSGTGGSMVGSGNLSGSGANGTARRKSSTNGYGGVPGSGTGLDPAMGMGMGMGTMGMADNWRPSSMRNYAQPNLQSLHNASTGPSALDNYIPPPPDPLLDPQLLAPQNNAQSGTGFSFNPALPGQSFSMSQPVNPFPYSNISNSSGVDPTQFMWALTSQLPVVEETSPPNGPASVTSQLSNNNNVQRLEAPPLNRGRSEGEGKVVKISWFRPHGQTAYAPGLKRITLKVKIDSPEEALQRLSPMASGPGSSLSNPGVQELLQPDGTPDPAIMRHLLDVFMVHFGCQFPGIDKADLVAKIDAKEGNAFLMSCIAGVAARFSAHPAIALPHLEPWAYGNVFYHRARSMLGSMLSVPSREAVLGFMLMAHMSFANDVESEIWMLTGMAVRMALDMGLHLNPPADSSISEDDKRLNRLVFYSVLILDCSLSFGVGRQTALRVDDITQPLPTEDDVRGSENAPPTAAPLPSVATGAKAAGASTSMSSRTPSHADDSTTRPVFPYAAKLMHSYGPLVNMLNRPQEEEPTPNPTLDAEITEARLSAIRLYNQLPQDMQWNVGNLQRHCKAQQGPIFVSMHLWMHTILASGYLTGTNLLRRPAKSSRQAQAHNQLAPFAHLTSIGAGAGNGLGAPPGSVSEAFSSVPVPGPGSATPNSAAVTSLWRNSARTIGDILVLADIISPNSYLALPFAVQPFYVASCCYVQEIEQTRSRVQTPSTSPRRRPIDLQMTASSDHEDASNGNKQLDLSRALLTSVATSNITTLQNGLSKQATYWSGVGWILGALEKRIEGFQVQDVDLAAVTEKLKSLISLPDASILGRHGDGNGVGNGARADQADMGQSLDGAQSVQDVANALGVGMGDDAMYGGFPDFDFLSTFDLGNPEGAQGVTEMNVPFPESWQSEWFK